MKRVVIGIDPASNSVGFAAIDPDARELLFTSLIVADPNESSRDRIRYIAEEISLLLAGIDPDLNAFVFSENSVMRGAGGATFQRAIGAIQSRVPDWMNLEDIQNSTVKKLVGGRGQADKQTVAIGAEYWFPERSESREQVRTLRALLQWDVTDAIAIAIAGWERKCTSIKI